jgi:hypothetical protein
MEAIGDTRIAQQLCGDLQLPSMSWDARSSTSTTKENVAADDRKNQDHLMT